MSAAVKQQYGGISTPTMVQGLGRLALFCPYRALRHYQPDKTLCSSCFLLLIFIFAALIFFSSSAVAGEGTRAEEGLAGERRQHDLDQLLNHGVSDVIWGNWILHPGQNSKQHRDDPVLLEVFSGVDYTKNQLSFYAGGVVRGRGIDPRVSGLRLKAVHGEGWYHYDSTRRVGVQSVKTRFEGRSRFLEALAGYEFRWMDMIFKAYGGVISIDHDIDPRDEFNQLQGGEVGAKFLLEAWKNIDEQSWFSAYATYSTANDYYKVHGRLGRHLAAWFDGGVEFGAFGDTEYDALRLGAFTRFNLDEGEFTFSAGVSGDYNEPDAFYVTGKYYKKLRLSDFQFLEGSSE